MTSTRTTTITLRVSHQLLARIDDSAKRAGEDRNAYVLSWLPDTYAAGCDTERNAAGGNGQRPHPSAPPIRRA
jgi:hypothetical protein